MPLKPSFPDGRTKVLPTAFSSLLNRCLTPALANAGPIVLFQFWFSLAYAVLLAPPSAWLLNRLVVFSGRPAISNNELALFFLSPSGLAFGVGSLAFVVGFVFLEQVGLQIVARSAFEGRGLRVARVMAENLILLPGVLRLGFEMSWRWLAAGLPFAGALAGVWLALLDGHDINYYLAVRPWQWWLALVLAGILGLGYTALTGWLLVRWLFAVPIVVFEGQPVRRALAASVNRTRGRRWELALPLLLWWLIIVASLSGLTWLVQTSVAWLVVRAGLNVALMLPLVLGGLGLIGLLNLVWFTAAKAVHAFMVIDLHSRLSPAETGPPAAGSLRADRLVGRLSPAVLRGLAWLGVIIALIMTTGATITFFKPSDRADPPEITAHRGSSLTAPENTLAALEQAIADRADWAEIDVQSTADGVVVVFHDADLMRLAGDGRRLAGLEFSQLADIDIGSWFHPRFAAQRIPTLLQAMETARGRIRLNIELKYNRPDPELAARVARLIREADFADQCLVTSLDARQLAVMRDLYPELKTGLIIFRALGRLERLADKVLSVNAGLAGGELVRAAHGQGKEIHVWTVNDPSTALTMMETGVDNIITDDPPLMRQTAAEWAALTGAEKTALWLRRFFVGLESNRVADL